MESAENPNLIQEVPTESQEKFLELLSVIDSLSEKMDSNIASEFVEYMSSNSLKFKDYFLANVFLARVANKDLPEESAYKYYDTKDSKIEAFIRSMAENA